MLEKIRRRDARRGGDERGVFGFEAAEQGAIFGRGGEQEADLGRWRRDADARRIDDLKKEKRARMDERREQDEAEESPGKGSMICAKGVCLSKTDECGFGEFSDADGGGV